MVAALGYKTSNAFWHVLKKLVNSGLVVEDTTNKPYIYRVNTKETKENERFNGLGAKIDR